MLRYDSDTLYRISALGCCVCRKMGYAGTPAETHISKRKESESSNRRILVVLPICPEHNRGKQGLKVLGRRRFEKFHKMSLADLIEETELLAALP